MKTKMKSNAGAYSGELDVSSSVRDPPVRSGLGDL